MKKQLLIFLIFIPFVGISQTDTIFKKDGKVIICTITMVNENNIFYKDNLDNGDHIELFKVERYTYKNKVVTEKDMPKNAINNNFSIMKDSVTVTNELRYMKECFAKCHSQYKKGAIVCLVGIAITSIGSAIIPQLDSGAALYLPLAGTVTTLVGAGIMIDSHKWIGRAAVGFNENGLGVKYIFK